MLGGALVLAAALAVTNGHVRDLLPGQTTTAAYGDIDNPTSEDAILVAVHTPIASGVEIHETREEAGMVRMRRLERLVIPARSIVRLQPGGLHLMLFDADTKGVLEAPFVFEFATGRRAGGTFEIRAP